jgi:hypothetical protein
MDSLRDKLLKKRKRDDDGGKGKGGKGKGGKGKGGKGKGDNGKGGPPLHVGSVGGGPPPGYVAGAGRGVRLNDRGVSSAYTKGLKGAKAKGKGKGKGGKGGLAGDDPVERPKHISRQQLLEFYDKYDPEKKANIDTILENFSGEQIEQNLINKYGDAPRAMEVEGAEDSRLSLKWKEQKDATKGDIEQSRLNVDSVEGQEEISEEVAAEMGGTIEAFSLKGDDEEGYYDADGNWVWEKDKEAVKGEVSQRL